MKKAFTLIEIMIVIAIIAVLSTIGGVYYGNTQEQAKLTDITKTVRELKDRLDVYLFENHNKISDEMRGSLITNLYGVNIFQVPKELTKELKMSQHYSKNLGGLNDVFVTYDGFRYFNNQESNKVKIIYLIGDNERCVLDEAVYVQDATHIWTKKHKPNNLHHKYGTVELDHKRVNFCVVAVGEGVIYD